MDKTLLLVDGSSYLYRAFHALPDLRSPTGEPTGALYGMISMLRRLRQDYPAFYIACVFDAKGETFRKALYRDYKANRSAMPDELVAQIAPIHEVVRYLGWPILMVEGVEADDVIGTLSVQAVQTGLRCIISTGDKDLAQLVNEHVTLVNTMTNEKLDVPGVCTKFGVPPSKIVDYLSLVGDTSDNVPGVAKVGPKTALKWLNAYGSLDEVMAHSQEIGGVVGDNLRQALSWLVDARTLVTIKTDCDLPQVNGEDTTPLSLQAQVENQTALIDFYKRYGFKTWLKDIQVETHLPTPSSPFVQTVQVLPEKSLATQYETIWTKEALTSWVEKISCAPLTALDTETTSLDPIKARLVGISLCCEVGVAAYIPLAHMYPGVEEQLSLDDVWTILKPWLESETSYKVGQHLKYDSHVLANHGITLRGVLHDTLLESYVLEAHKPHDLDSLAKRHLDRDTITFESVCGKGVAQIGFDQVRIDAAAAYAAEDADVTFALHHKLFPQIEVDPGLYYIYRSIELPVSQVLQTIERQGVLIDVALLNKQSLQIGEKLFDLEKTAYDLAGQSFNMNSPKQIAAIFFEQLHLPVIKKTPSGAPSTDEAVLQKLAENYPLPKVILEYRTLAKLKSTYIDKLPKMVNIQTGRVHTNYAQAVAITGRLASNEPNLQNIPIRHPEGRRIREAFIAPPGSVLVSADYSQIELRIMAHLSEDSALLEAFAAGEDIHRATAAEVFGVGVAAVTEEQRRYAKTINFGLIYGMSAYGLAANLGIDRQAAQHYIDRYFLRYPGVLRYMNDIRMKAQEKGFVETVFGRRLWLNDIHSSQHIKRQGAERAAINAPMQGTAADLIKLAMIAVQNWLEAEKMNSKLIMQVHDELVLEVLESELAQVKETLPMLMEGVAALRVPLLVQLGVGRNWDQAH